MSYKRNYKFKVGDKVELWNLIRFDKGYEVFCRYHSDEENHSAKPHNRYVIVDVYGGTEFNIDDVCEAEIRLEEK